LDSGAVVASATADRGSVAPPDWPSPRSSFTPPGRVSRAILLALLFVEIVALGLLYVPMPPNPDQELYDYMAWSAITRGGLYRNGGDMNMPDQALLHIVSMKAFGDHYWSYRLLDYILFVGSMGGVALLCRRYYGRIFSGLFLGLYPIVYTTSGHWMAGQRDLLATHAILLAGFAYARRIEGGGVRWLIAPGTAMASATLLKPTFLAFGPIQIFLAYLFVRRPIGQLAKDATILGVVGAVLLGSVLALGWATDSLDAWREMALTYSLQNYVGGRGVIEVARSIARVIVAQYNWYTLMALAGLACLSVEGQKSPLSVVLAVVSTVVISTFVQRKGFGYHFGGLLSVMSLLCACYLTEVIRLAMRASRVRQRLAVLSFPALLISGGMLAKVANELRPQMAWYLDRSQFVNMLKSNDFDDVLEASDFVRSATKPDETVWTNSSHLMINSLSERSFPGRFISYALVRFNEASPLGEGWRREVEAIFRERPPQFIVLEVISPSAPDVFFNMGDIRPHEPISAMKEALDRDYVRDRQVGRFAFYRRDDSKASRTPSTP
jgi:hypothetical protein